MPNTYLTRTMETATDRKKMTLSMWVKNQKINTYQQFCDFYVSPDIRISIYQDESDRISIYMKGGGFAGSGANIFFTNAKYRDCNAWYHYVWRFDTTQGTAADRVRFYVNGEQVTSFASTSYPDQNFQLQFGTSSYTQIYGKYGADTNNFFNGAMSHINFCDGYSYAPTEFGETDTTTGEWKIKTSPSVTYGNNGHWILKDGNSVTDQSGESNNFTVAGGTLTKTEDNPSNVFATLNPLDNYHAGGTFANGNTKYTTISSKHDFAVSNLGMQSGSGKFYAEFKVHQNTDYNMIGISDHGYQGSNQELSEDNYSYGYYNDGGASAVRGNASTILSSMPSYGDGDIIGVAVDLENHKLYFSKNGTFINSGDPTSGSTGTGAVSINNLSTTPNTDARGQGVYFFGAGMWNSSNSGSYSANFGNGYFGSTQISSAGTNASGNGIFEYNVPAGYTALSTKGLNL